ncbi:N-alpha-acetyltransferase 35, NatC auxiliary subunit-like protein, partial [Euroglyphus maynei]
NALSVDEFLSQLNENLNLSEGLIEQWLATIDYGIKPNVNNVEQSSSTSNKPDYPTIIGFEPLINQRLLAPSFPRYIKIKNRIDTVKFLQQLLQRIRKLLKVREIEKFIDVLRFFNAYSQQSCVVSRSLLQLFYLPQDDQVFGEREFQQIVKDSCKCFIKPPILCGKITLDMETKEIVESFFDLCKQFFKKVLQIYGHNRASQRGKLAIIIKDIVYISEKCAILEQVLLLRSFCDHLQVWIMFYKFYFISQYLLSGFELELYSIHEYDNSANNSTMGLNQMSAAMYRLMMAFMIDEKIQPLKQSINSEEIRYRHRFAPLLQFDGTLQSYTNYKQCLDTFIRTKSTRLLYSESCQLFEQARKNFESLQNDSTFHDEVNMLISEIFKIFKI